MGIAKRILGIKKQGILQKRPITVMSKGIRHYFPNNKQGRKDARVYISMFGGRKL
jgi:hypothetical protein